jgi:PAS domain S-box-containing protein
MSPQAEYAFIMKRELTDNKLDDDAQRAGDIPMRGLGATMPLDTSALDRFSKETLARVLDAVHNGVTVYDRNGTLVWVNERGCTLHGLPRAELIGRNVSEMATLPTTEAVFSQEIDGASAKELRRTHREMMSWRSPGYVVFRDGQRMFYTGTFIENKQGECEYAVYTLHEVTEVEEMRNQIAELRRKASLYEDQLHALHRHALGHDMIARSAAMQNVLTRAIKIARLDSNILITGETGVGKTLLARYVHVTSPRSKAPFIHVNCASLPESMIEAELFGHVAGAFTGASRKGRRGLIEQGQAGTVFLDEISEMPPEMQAKLLTIIEDKMIRRIGDEKWSRLDVRFIAATNCDPRKLMNRDGIREDLYYRLAMSSLFIPPLRERPQDITPLADLMLAEFNTMNDSELTLGRDALTKLQKLPLTGNSRELKAIVWEMGASADHGAIELGADALSAAIAETSLYGDHGSAAPDPAPTAPQRGGSDDDAARLQALCNELDGDVYAVAEALGVHRTTVIRKCQRYGIPYARRRSQSTARQSGRSE